MFKKISFRYAKKGFHFFSREATKCNVVNEIERIRNFGILAHIDAGKLLNYL